MIFFICAPESQQFSLERLLWNPSETVATLRGKGKTQVIFLRKKVDCHTKRCLLCFFVYISHFKHKHKSKSRKCFYIVRIQSTFQFDASMLNFVRAIDAGLTEPPLQRLIALVLPDAFIPPSA